MKIVEREEGEFTSGSSIATYYGIGKILGKQKRCVDGKEWPFYEVLVKNKNLKLLLPVEGVKGVRRVISKEEAREKGELI